MSEPTDARPPAVGANESKKRREWRTSSLVIVAILSAIITFAVLSLAFSISQRKEEARSHGGEG